jgi:hypothetical protein
VAQPPECWRQVLTDAGTRGTGAVHRRRRCAEGMAARTGVAGAAGGSAAQANGVSRGGQGSQDSENGHALNAGPVRVETLL